jgi:hypothetical protein
LAVEEA